MNLTKQKTLGLFTLFLGIIKLLVYAILIRTVSLLGENNGLKTFEEYIELFWTVLNKHFPYLYQRVSIAIDICISSSLILVAVFFFQSRHLAQTLSIILISIDIARVTALCVFRHYQPSSLQLSILFMEILIFIGLLLNKVTNRNNAQK